MTDNINTAYRPSIVAFPVWRQDGDSWHLLAGNESVAQLVPNVDSTGLFGQTGARIWLSVIESRPDYGWHAVDFAELEHAKALLTTWWTKYASRNAPASARFECPHCSRTSA